MRLQAQRNPPMDDNKAKALAAALSQIEKQFGKGSIMRLGESEISRDIKVVTTGSLGLELALGIGGRVGGGGLGRYVPVRSGKTTVGLGVNAYGQQVGGLVAFVACEARLAAEGGGSLASD